MRNLIIKYFAMDYIVKFGSKNIVFARASTILFPLFCINGVITVTVDEMIWNHPLGLFSLIVLVIGCYFGFFYFNSNPIKGSEFNNLDKSQKWQFGKWVFLGGMNGIEWQEINSNKQMYSPFWVILVNPICLVLLILFSIL